MKPGRSRSGALSAVLLALPSCGAAWLFLVTGFPVFAAGVVGFAISALVCRALYGHETGLIWIGFAAAAVFSWIGLQLGYVSLIMRENAAYGCTFADALSILPQVLASPVNREAVLSDHLQIGLALILALVLALLSVRKTHKA